MPSRAQRPTVRAVLLLLLLSVGGAGACAPETDLTQIPGNSGVTGPLGPAGAVLMDPEPGSVDVPLNLAAIVVRFPAPIVWGAGGLRICDGEGGGLPSAAPVEISCEGGACYRADVLAPLPPAAPCRIGLGDGAIDVGGSAIEGGLIGIFDTAATRDELPPALAEVSVAVSGPCLAVSFATDEPAAGTVVAASGEVANSTAAGTGKTRFDLALPLGSLPPSAPATITVRVVDRAGNVAESAPFPFETPPPLPPLAITEVLANPAGPEPAQEQVELQNLGDAPLSLAGLRLEDAKGGDDLPDVTIAPGAYALVVPSGYAEQQGQDPPPRAATAVVRVDTRLGADGLANGGELLRLTMGELLVSSYGGWVPVSAGSWAGRSVHRMIPSACDRPDAWSRTPLEPTPGWGPP